MKIWIIDHIRMLFMFLALIQSILYRLGRNSYSQQQIHPEDDASQIKDGCITIPISQTSIYQCCFSFNLIASTNASLTPGAHAGLELEFSTVIQSVLIFYLEACHKGVGYSSSLYKFSKWPTTCINSAITGFQYADFTAWVAFSHFFHYHFFLYYTYFCWYRFFIHWYFKFLFDLIC